MRLVAVTRILNEDDIVEAFVRHHATIVDEHIFLDNGSVDRTLEILAALAIEGVRVTVLQNCAAHYADAAYNDTLLHQAAGQSGADWVVFLDADEFVDARHCAGGLRARLAALPPATGCLKLLSIDYLDMPDDDGSELIVPKRMRRRERVARMPVPRVSIRGALAARGARVLGGNHAAAIGDVEIRSRTDKAIRMAHFSRRDGLQAVTKAVLGRLKVLASGRAAVESGISYHYTATFETIRDRPEELLRNQAFLAATYEDRDPVDDPIDYLGGPLRYTRATDPALKAIRTLAGYMELLALDHGRLADGDDRVRSQMEAAARACRLLFSRTEHGLSGAGKPTSEIGGR